jgi:hypothetical protein
MNGPELEQLLLACAGNRQPGLSGPTREAVNMVYHAARGTRPYLAAHSTDIRRIEAAVLRDLFGNPIRSTRIDPAWLTWNGGTIPKLAQAVYDDRAFDRLPVLADALEEAGCTNTEILAHCRGPGPHVRGCWAVDLLLGKT